MIISESYIFRLATVLVKSFREDLTQEEQQMLDEWLVAAGKNKHLYLRLQKEEWLEEKIKESLLIDYEEDCTAFILRIKKNRRLQRRRILSRYGAAAVVFLFVGLGIWFLQKRESSVSEVASTVVFPDLGQAVLTFDSGEQMVLNVTDTMMAREGSGVHLNIEGKGLSYCKMGDSTVREIKYNTLYVPRGGEYYLELADGTTIWLNSESTLRYPVTFSGDKRMIYLEGEAFFKVAKNKKMPFIVIAGGTRMEVLGTEFNLRAYLDEEVVSTTLVEGAVSMSSNEKDHQIILGPGEQGNVVKASGLTSKHTVDTYLYTAWKDGRLVFRSCRMEDLLKVLSRWYDVEIFFQNSKVRDIRFSGDMCKTEHIDALLNIIENNGLVTFERHGRVLLVRMR